MPHLGLTDLSGSILYFGAILVFLLSVCGRPHLGLFFLVPLLPMQTIRYRLHAYPLGANLVDIILLGVCIGLWRQGESPFPKTPFNKLLIAFGIFTYLSLWRGAFFLHGDLPLWFNDRRLQDWKNDMLMLAIPFLVFAAIKTKRQIKMLLICMSASVLIIDRAFYHTVKDRDFSHFSYDLRDAGALGYAGVNGLAAFQVQFVVLLLALYCFEKSFALKCFYLGTAAFSTYCILFSFSRGGYAAFLAGCLFLGVLKHKGLLILVVVLLCSWQTLVPGAVRERILMTQDENGEVDSSSGERLTIWQDALQVFQADPIFGTGVHTYEYMHRVGEYSDTHNLYVKVLVETGLLGLSLLLLIFWRIYAAGRRLFRMATDPLLASVGLGLAAVMVCVFVGNLFGDRWNYLQVSGYTWAILGLVLRGTNLTIEAADEDQQSAVESFAATVQETT